MFNNYYKFYVFYVAMTFGAFAAQTAKDIEEWAPPHLNKEKLHEEIVARCGNEKITPIENDEGYKKTLALAFLALMQDVKHVFLK